MLFFIQPPIHVTGDPNFDWIIFVVGAFMALYWLRALRLAREGARLFLLNIAEAILVFCISTWVFTRMGMQPTDALPISAFVGVLFLP